MTGITKLDYSALERSPSRVDRVRYKSQFGSARKSEQIIGSIIAVVMISVFYWIFGSVLILEFDLNGFALLVLYAILLGFGVRALYKGYRSILVTGAKIQSFTKMNGLSYKEYVTQFNQQGVIFRVGHTKEITRIIETPDSSVQVGNYRYTTGSGKNSTVHSWSFLRMKLPRTLPNMVLDAKGNNSVLNASNLPGALKKSQTLSLEGNFNDYFTLYAPEEYKTDALYIFTPDVMSAILESDGAYDMEIVGDELYFYSNSSIKMDSKDTLSKLFGLASKVYGQLSEQTTRYSDHRVDEALSKTTIHEGGRRLKSGTPWAKLIGVFGVILAWVAFVGGIDRNFIGVIIAVVVILSSVIGFVHWTKKRRE